MAVKPDPTSTTASTYNSDCILDIGQVPRLPDVYEPNMLYDELLDVHNALEALSECAGTDDCYCIELCEVDECKEYECDSYKNAVLSIFSGQLKFYHVLDEDYAAGVVVDSSPVGFDGSRYSSEPTDTTDSDQSPYMDTCSPEPVPLFNSNQGGSSKVENVKIAPDENEYLGFGDDITSCFLMNLRDVSPSTGEFTGFQVNDQVTGGNGAPNSGYVMRLTQIDPPKFQYAFNHDTADYRIRFTSPEMDFSFLDTQWNVILLHVRRTPTSCYIKCWVKGKVVWDQLYLSSEEGLVPLLASNPIWTVDVSWAKPLKRGPAIGHIPWGQGSPAPFTGSNFFAIPGIATDEQAVLLYDAYLRNFSSYVDPDPDCGIDSIPTPDNNQGLIYRSAGISEVTGLEEGCWEFACMPEVCCAVPGPGYLCDSFLDALNATVSNVWPMNDTTGSGEIVATKGGVNVPQFGTPVYEKTSLLADACDGAFSASDHGLEGWEDSSLAQGSRVPILLEGSTGGLVDATTANVRITTLGFLSQTDVKLGLNHNGNTVQVILEGNGIGQLQLDWAGTPTTATSFIMINYTLAGNGDYDIELFVDFVSYGSEVGNFAGNTFTINSDTKFTLGGAGNGNLDNQFMYYNTGRLSTAQISFLSDAWDQNQSDYVPISTGTPVPGQVLKAIESESGNTYCAEDIYPEGSANQILTRNSAAPDDVSWSDAGTAAGGSVIFSPYDPDPVATGTFWVTGGY